MKTLHLILGLLFYSLVIAASGALIVAAGSQDAVNPWIDHLQQAPPPCWALSGVFILAILFAYLLSGLPWCRKKNIILFENADGAIGVGTEAVQNYLNGIKSEFAAIVSFKSSVAIENGALAITLKLGVKEGTQIPELCRMTQTRVKELIAEHLGACDLKGVAVEVNEIRPGR